MKRWKLVFNRIIEYLKVLNQETPVRKLEADNAKLRKALVDLVGVDTKAELEGMEAIICALPLLDKDDMCMLRAIRTLRDTAS